MKFFYKDVKRGPGTTPQGPLLVRCACVHVPAGTCLTATATRSADGPQGLGAPQGDRLDSQDRVLWGLPPFLLTYDVLLCHLGPPEVTASVSLIWASTLEFLSRIQAEVTASGAGPGHSGGRVPCQRCRIRSGCSVGTCSPKTLGFSFSVVSGRRWPLLFLRLE